MGHDEMTEGSEGLVEVMMFEDAGEILLQGSVCARQSRFDRPDRAPEYFGNLFIGEAFDVAERHDRSELWAQLTDRMLNFGFELGCTCVFFGGTLLGFDAVDHGR